MDGFALSGLAGPGSQWAYSLAGQGAIEPARRRSKALILTLLLPDRKVRRQGSRERLTNLRSS